MLIKDENPHWFSILSEFISEAETFIFGKENYENQYRFGRKVESIFGGMCSLNDISFSKKGLRKKKILYSTLQCFLRECWHQMDKEWNQVSPKDIFSVGENVQLIPGEVIIIGRDEKRKRAPKSQMTYEITSINLPDITNMPTYTICWQNKLRLARPNALRKVTT